MCVDGVSENELIESGKRSEQSEMTFQTLCTSLFIFLTNAKYKAKLWHQTFFFI